MIKTPPPPDLRPANVIYQEYHKLPSEFERAQRRTLSRLGREARYRAKKAARPDPAEILRRYHAAKDNGDVELAQRLWREYWDACAATRKTDERAA